SNACIPRSKCDAGSPKYCPSWALLPSPPKPVENPKVGLLGSHSPNEHAFLSSARSLPCLNLFQRDPPLFLSVPLLCFSQNCFRCSARAVCPNTHLQGIVYFFCLRKCLACKV